MNTNTLTNRHDFLFLFDVANGNPNGDPDAGNQPRQDPNTSRGVISDVCLKRKVRNFVEQFASPAGNGPNGHQNQIFVSQGAILNNLIDAAEAPASAKQDAKKNRDLWEKEALDWLCRRYYDLRTFGAVLSTDNKVFKGSTYGQVRGPVQFTFAQSFHPITPLEITITRCAVTKEADAKKERTMGNKHIVSYALYAAKGYVSPAFAERTGFTNADLDLLFEALLQMFEHDRSAARGEMIVRGLYDFEHVGTQHANNAKQNGRESRLGCYHAHKLFEGIQVQLKDGKTLPESFADYDVICNWTEKNLPAGVKLNLQHEAKSLGPLQT